VVVDAASVVVELAALVDVLDSREQAAVQRASKAKGNEMRMGETKSPCADNSRANVHDAGTMRGVRGAISARGVSRLPRRSCRRR
jgi:hypothetical protein